MLNYNKHRCSSTNIDIHMYQVHIHMVDITLHTADFTGYCTLVANTAHTLQDITSASFISGTHHKHITQV